jgi:hypothetical protein
VPDHLPGSWNPRSNWKRPADSAPPHVHSAWSLRCALVLLYWADRLDAAVCVAERSDVTQALDIALGSSPTDHSRAVSLGLAATLPDRAEPPGSDPVWVALQRASRPRTSTALDAIASLLENTDGTERSLWRLRLAQHWLPEPSLLLARMLRGDCPDGPPALPRLRLRRSPLLLLG